MSAPRPIGSPGWRKFYEAALLEVDLAKIPDRVEQARKAIQDALTECSSQGKNEDCRRLLDCLTVLNDVLKMYETAEHEQ